MLRNFLGLLFAFQFLVPPANAQYSERISTARPGVSIGPNTVGDGILQFQQGLEYSFIDAELDPESIGVEGARRVDNFINVINITRFGISRKFELSAVLSYGGHESYLINEQGEKFEELKDRTNEFRVVDLGGRYNLRESANGGPAIGIQARVGFEPILNDRGSPELKLIASAAQRFANIHGLTVNLGYTGRDYTSDLIIYTLKYSLSIGKKMALMVENYGHYAFGNGDQTDYNSFFDVGYSYLVTNNIQFDLQAGFANNEIASSGRARSDWFVGGGISWRVKLKE